MTPETVSVSGRLPAIKFTSEWDKLQGKSFTTIRSYAEEKEQWYTGLVGKRFRVRLVRKPYTWSYGDKTLFMAYLRSVRRVVPRELGRDLLEEDVRLGGKPDGKWLLKLIDMPSALLLTFDRCPEVTLD